MKLSQENIQFIDRYLKNSGVEYFDIRMEMLDHVATAVEQKMETESLDFYDAFKNYMVVNKKELMKENEKINKLKLKNCLPFLKFLIQPKSLLIETIIFGFLFAFKNHYFFSNLEFFVSMAFVMLFVALIQFYLFYFIVKDRLYAVEKSAIVLIILYNGLHFFTNFLKVGSKNEKADFYIVSFTLIVSCMYLIFYIKELIKHRKFYMKKA